tara:strand:- start:2618 stop:2746 length:129 start_codon:yes stop_codon:yes gene_type:complete
MMFELYGGGMMAVAGLVWLLVIVVLVLAAMALLKDLRSDNGT